MDRTIKMIESINATFGRYLGWIILIVSLLVGYDTVMRYLFSSPSEWVQEISLYGFAVFAMMGSGYVQLRKSHIRTDVISGQLNLKHLLLCSLRRLRHRHAGCGVGYLLDGADAKPETGGHPDVAVVALFACHSHRYRFGTCTDVRGSGQRHQASFHEKRPSWITIRKKKGKHHPWNPGMYPLRFGARWRCSYSLGCPLHLPWGV